MERISAALTDKIMSWGRYDSECREEIHYAISIFLWDSLTLLLSLLAVYALWGEMKPALLFAFCFAVLRQFSGGIHAQTHVQCLVSTIAVFILGSVLQKALHPMLVYAMGGMAVVGVWILSPLENSKKHFTLAQRRRYRRVAHQILLFESILAVISGAMDAQLAGSVSMAIVMVFALQVMEKMTKDEMKKGEISFV